MRDQEEQSQLERPGRVAWRRFRRRKTALFAGVLLLGLSLTLAAWPLLQSPGIAGRLPQALTWSSLQLSNSQFEAPSAVHWFGTDLHGRDVLSRVVEGAQISLLVGLLGAAVSLVIGVCWGGLAGYLGGRWDGVMMRTVDILYATPSIVLVMVLMAMMEGPFRDWLSTAFSPEVGAAASLLLLFVGLGAVSWLSMARVVRAQVLSLRHRGFVEASRVLGASHGQILRRHILPNLWGVILVYLTLSIPSIVLYESFLSYLGLGIQAPYASLGNLIAGGASQINPVRTYWWLLIFPGGTLVGTLLLLNLLGDGLREVWDPRASEERSGS